MLLTLLNVSASLAQIVALVIMYWLATKQFRMSKSSTYLERFLGREVLELRESIDVWLSGDHPASKRLEEINLPEQAHRKAQMIAFANFFQELGIAYKHNLADKKYVRETFSFLASHYWQRLNFWIAAYRDEKHRPTLYAEWEYLYNEIKSHEKPRQAQLPQHAG